MPPPLFDVIFFPHLPTGRKMHLKGTVAVCSNLRPRGSGSPLVFNKPRL